ncbi:hypothetical protein [Schleiferilactobacillus harbinensis]|uniref:Uncharacterized protein n=1 Tax=Schleiferilactobacillus harbinensis TaxID=304207 RepID=A0A5P8MA25_9LACO|nr:hypothetical protein [Schleiferilactobacillus harbinensis]QFR25055.1 hypothetical protein D1010_17615 [Schleiferilactobacillus harbinensis]
MNTPYGWEWPDYIEADARLDKYFKAQRDTVEQRDLLHAKPKQKDTKNPLSTAMLNGTGHVK